MQNVWQELSKSISETIAQAGRAVVAIDGRSGHTSSGLVWRPNLILTAAHTVRQESNIHVILRPGYSVQAQLAGKASGADIALLRTEQDLGQDLAQFGDTDSLAVGELVVAVARTRRGNLVASSGILGGLMGEWQAGRTRIDRFIRPDLTLYPGFSGGALVGSDGRILGMTNGGLIRGKAITVPASTLTRIGEELNEKGYLHTPYIGLVMQPVQLPESLQQKTAVVSRSGLLVMHVEPGGPADAAGVILGDIIIDLDGRTFTELGDLQTVLRDFGVGQDVKATLIRGGQKLQLSIKIGERPLR
jgi:S1-C subfamily serine protease